MAIWSGRVRRIGMRNAIHSTMMSRSVNFMNTYACISDTLLGSGYGW